MSNNEVRLWLGLGLALGLRDVAFLAKLPEGMMAMHQAAKKLWQGMMTADREVIRTALAEVGIAAPENQTAQESIYTSLIRDGRLEIIKSFVCKLTAANSLLEPDQFAVRLTQLLEEYRAKW